MVPGVPDRLSGWPPSLSEIEAAQNGDEGCLRGILTAGIPKLMAFYWGLGVRRADAEDLASDTCEAIVRSLPKLRDPSRFEPWFWRIARSKFYDQLRRKGRTHQPIEREEMYDDPSDSLVIADEHSSIRVAFSMLKVKDRELLWLRDVLDLPYADIAGRFRMREGAVRIALMRARQRLEEALEQVEQQSEGTRP